MTVEGISRRQQLGGKVDSVWLEVRINWVKQKGQYLWLQGNPVTAGPVEMSSKQPIHSALVEGGIWCASSGVFGRPWLRRLVGRILKSLRDLVVRALLCCSKNSTCSICGESAAGFGLVGWLCGNFTPGGRRSPSSFSEPTVVLDDTLWVLSDLRSSLPDLCVDAVGDIPCVSCSSFTWSMEDLWISLVVTIASWFSLDARMALLSFNDSSTIFRISCGISFLAIPSSSGTS